MLFFPWGMWDLGSLTKDWTHIPAPEDELLTTGPPGKSQLSGALFPSSTVTGEQGQMDTRAPSHYVNIP